MSRGAQVAIPMRRLSHPPAHLGLEQRRTWRMLAFVNALVLTGTAFWAGVIALSGLHIALAIYAGVALASAGNLWVLRQGKLLLASRLTIGVLLAFLLYNAIWLNAPTPELPRSAHQYLLALGVASLLITRGDRAWLRHGVPFVCLAAYVALAGSHFTLATDTVVDATLRLWGSWFDHLAAAGVLLLTMHVIHSDVVRREGSEAELRDALQNGEFELHYQAQVDEDGQVLGAEALLRGEHPQRGMVSPRDFIPLAEDCGLIRPLGDWALDHACAQLSAWSTRPVLRDLVLAVNVSAQQFEQAGFVQRVLGLLAHHQVDPARLKIELTESALAQDLPSVVAKMKALRSRGVQLSLDDFGTGYSSLNVLRHLPLDQVKIDRSFVRHLGRTPRDEAVVRTIIALGHSLGMEVIAEGVETLGQQQVLRRLGCRHYQGYMYARPLPAPDLERALEQAQKPGPASRAAVLNPQPTVPTPDTLPMALP